jgi:mannose-6-phosphate isomerase-like protein (cupin superfamily)
MGPAAGGEDAMGTVSAGLEARRVRVVDLGDGKRTDLPGGSWVCELVSGPLNGAAATMLGFSTWVPGADTTQLVHEVDELCYIVSGSGKLSVGPELVPYDAGQAVLIPAGVPHGVVNDGDAPMSMIYVFSHPAYPPTREATEVEREGSPTGKAGG